MNATFKMLSTLRDEKYAKMANEELAIAYQHSDLNASILAEMYCRNFTILINFCDCSSLSNDTEDNTGYDNDDNFIAYNHFDNYMSEVELIDTIKHSNLSLIEKKVCYLFMKSDTCTREEIANKLGVSRQTVQIAIKNLKQKLKFVLD